MKANRIILTIVFLMICGCAAQSDVIILDERLARLESKIERQSKTIDQFGELTEDKEQKLRSQSASLRVQIDDLRNELQVLNGRLEEIEHALSQQTMSVEEMGKNRKEELERLNKDFQSVEQRLANLEQYLDLGGTQKSAPPSTKPSLTVPIPDDKNLDENDLYRLAKQSFDQGDFESARAHFQELIKRYPKSKSADNAQFWIGEIYYREKWYEKAIVEYQKVIEDYPDGNKVSAALLKQGYAFANIGDKDSARLVLRELIRKHPDSNEAKFAQRKLKQLD
jgi:tol-pal system protein YbgF